MHLKKNIKIGEFLCSHFSIEDGRKYSTCLAYVLYYFKKGKNPTETQKYICAGSGEGAVIDRTCQKWFVKFCAGDFSLDNGPQWVDQLKLIAIKSRH